MNDSLTVIVRSARPLHCLLALAMLLPFAASAETGRYRLSWRDDPTTTMVIGWDQIDGSDAVVHWGPEDHGQDIDAYPARSTADVVHHYRSMNNQFVRLTGLQPDTAYYFVIKDDDSSSCRL